MTEISSSSMLSIAVPLRENRLGKNELLFSVNLQIDSFFKTSFFQLFFLRELVQEIFDYSSNN